MTTEQNQPQPPENPVQAQASNQGQNHGEGGGRRRRRRRKRNKGGQAQANGQSQQAQPQSQQPQSFKPKPPKPQPSSQTRFFKSNNNNGNGNGQYQGGGGGGRRRNKPRRERVFVGPMDHSYRTVNGNVADGPPSTIELRNGNVNGNGHYENSAPWEAPPPPVREDAPTRIYLFIEDLFFFAKINETARKLGIKVAFVKNDPQTIAKIIEAPEDERASLIVFDLNNAAAKPMTLIPKIKSKLKKGTSVIGFLSHLQGDLKAKAVEAGCDIVMPRSAFSQNLPTLLRRHGVDEEQEAEMAQQF
jgi:hypothetical protein